MDKRDEIVELARFRSESEAARMVQQYQQPAAEADANDESSSDCE